MIIRRRWLLLALAILVLLLAACDDGGAREAPSVVEFEPALDGRVFGRPVELGPYPGGRIFVAQQDGRVLLTDEDGADLGVLLDLGGRVGLDPGEGLLSVALAPDFGANGQLWAYYFAREPDRSVLARFDVEDGHAEATSELVVLEIAQPGLNQNGGAIRFGPDGMLYLSVGDGSASLDPFEQGQDRTTLLGTVLRLDVREASATEPYRIPPDNPFVDDPAARGEIWAYGLRNPWRMAFDEGSDDAGTLWLGDVGASTEEEIDRIERSGNYGWSVFEGTHCIAVTGECEALEAVPPAFAYRHDEAAEGAMRCAAIGGVVYRGEALPGLDGHFLFADLCSGELWALSPEPGAAPLALDGGIPGLVSFALDEPGEVLAIDTEGRAWRIVAAQ